MLVGCLCSHRRGIILDAFAESGTTLVAAHKAGRHGYGIELDTHYCDVTLARLTKVAKVEAVLVATGQTFEAAAAKRAQPLACRGWRGGGSRGKPGGGGLSEADDMGSSGP